MPEESNKNVDKKKHVPKEQRKPRHSRNTAGKGDRKAEKIEDTKPAHKVTVPQKPVYEDPGPEFYKNLKRETEEIVKITEAENSKYRKKEIQSNWAKYEMPIESYEDLDEQDVGADYEKLIQAPLTAGGHFQFKHEKSWDTSTAPSLYDKYFEINMDNLSTAISSIPFYERNDIKQSEFSETDLLSMNNRASKYKLKYFNDKSYSTAETAAQERIINTMRDNFNIKDTTEPEKLSEAVITEEKSEYQVNLTFDMTKANSNTSVHSTIQAKHDTNPNVMVDEFDDEFIFKDVPNVKTVIPEAVIEKTVPAKTYNVPTKSNTTVNLLKEAEPQSANKATPEHPVISKVNPVIESPEDLEKWLDDFLDS